MLLTRFKEDNTVEIGVDEAGRGSFWGPIMAGAVILPEESQWTDQQKMLFIELRDSKKLTPKKRERLFLEIKEQIVKHSVGIVHAHEINEKGITWANMEAFRRAVNGLLIESTECRLLIDGILAIEDWEGDQELIVEGDSKYISIAAASILAKVEHDHWIQSYCIEYPECNERYDLSNSKGYGTKKHRDGINLYGGHELHRDLYIQNWLPGATKKPKKTRMEKTNKCLIKF